MQKRTNAGKPAARKPDRRGLFGLFAKKKDIPTTAQQTLPYREMYRDEMCIRDRVISYADKYVMKPVKSPRQTKSIGLILSYFILSDIV